MIVNVSITNKIARAEKHEPLVCGNSDYFIEFTFDDEWNAHHTKTARFIFGDQSYEDVVFNGSQCAVPVLQNTNEVKVGVYAGDLKTTTPAYLRAKRSILCGSGLPKDPTPDVYAQILALLNELEQNGVNDEQIAQAIADYLTENPIEGVSAEDVQKAVEEALQAAKESGEFDGAQGVGVTGAEIIDNYLHMYYSDGMIQVLGNVRGPQGPRGATGLPGANGMAGKSAYKYAQEGGYTGTEAEFAAKLAAEIPEAYDLPTASADTLGGVKVGGGLRMDGDVLGVVRDEYELIKTITIEEDGITNIVFGGRESDSLELTSAVVLLARPATEKTSLGNCLAYDREGTRITGTTISNFMSTSLQHMRVEITMTEYGCVTTYRGSTIAALTSVHDVHAKSTNPIGKIEFQSNNKEVFFPIETTVELWGVRADA